MASETASPRHRREAADGYLVPAAERRIERVVVNSRFIATAAPAFTVEEARAFIARMRREFADATHNVPAFLIGHGNRVIAHCSDDGEPAGTAGRPMLAILRGSGLGDIVVVVTRYFGGTKLGTGGLVRAYSDAVREVLRVLPLARRVRTHTVMIALNYAFFEPVRRLIHRHGGEVLDTTFAADITITARFAVKSFPAFRTAVRERTANRAEVEIVEADQETLLTVSDPALIDEGLRL